MKSIENYKNRSTSLLTESLKLKTTSVQICTYSLPFLRISNFLTNLHKKQKPTENLPTDIKEHNGPHLTPICCYSLKGQSREIFVLWFFSSNISSRAHFLHSEVFHTYVRICQDIRSISTQQCH